jgi:uncharacterized membrane protein
MTQNRFRSKVAWLAVVALLGFVLGNYGLYDAIGMTNESFKTLVDLAFAALTTFGVFNNPTDASNF